MKPTLIGIIVALSIAVVLLGAAVVRLENYRYANFVGMCLEYGINDPKERIKREDCLENTQTRTHWFWHILYGLRVL